MKTWILIGSLTLVLIAIAVAAKLAFFPSIKDAYFAMDNRQLQRVPAGLLVIRPTHFPNERPNGILYASTTNGGGDRMRIMGCNVALSNIVAAAYGQNSARVVMPPGTPPGNYDFLVTMTGDPQKHLQDLIRQKLGYTAQTETRETDVLALKVADPNLPAMTVSGADEQQNMVSKDTKLYFTHMPLSVIAQGLQQFVKMPVVDKTGTTNFYDFTVDWNFKVQREMRNDVTARDAAEKIIGDLGLALEPDTASVEMLVVKKTL